MLERVLAEHDDQFPEIVQRIIDQLTTSPGFLNQVFRVLGIRRSPRISERQKSAMSFFIGLQYLRTKEFRTIIRHSMEEFVTQLRDFIPPEQLDAAFDGFRGLGEANVRMHHLQMLSDPKFLQTMSDSLYKHIWVLGLNETKHILYSSDNPVVRRPHREHPVLRHTGVASPGIEVAMPLSSNHILILMERAHFAALTKSDRKVVPLRAEQIEYYNSLQVGGCDRQIYCAEDDFDLARDMCRRLPDLCHPERRRVASN